MFAKLEGGEDSGAPTRLVLLKVYPWEKRGEGLKEAVCETTRITVHH